jgi:hypothetical protein
MAYFIQGGGVKTNHLATLATVALETIKKIETEMKKDSPEFRRQKPMTASPTESFQRSLQKARQICQAWTLELKSVPAANLLAVTDLFLITISHIIVRQVIYQQIFQEEESLLNLVDDILACGDGHPDLVLMQLRSHFYRALIIMQRENQVNAIIPHLKTVLVFQSDQLFERCRQIQMLDTLGVACTSRINQPDWKAEDQDRICEIGTQIMQKAIDIYDHVPASYHLPGWNRVIVYGNLVLHSLGLARRYFAESSQAPERAKCYRERMEYLLARLQRFLDHQRLSPHESECRLILELLINFLQALGPKDTWLLKSLTTLARDFALNMASPQVLAYRATIAAFAKPDKEKPALTEQVEKKLCLQEAIKTVHLAALALRVLSVIQETITELKVGSEKTAEYLIRQRAQAAGKICESWLESGSSVYSIDDALVVIDFLLKKVAHWIAGEEIRSDIFQQEKQLLDLIDRILADDNPHSDLTFVQFHSRYYRALCYMTQHRDHIDDIVMHGNATLAFHCDKVSDRCKQIRALYSLVLSGLARIDELSLKANECDKMLVLVGNLAQEVADVYESIPASASLPSWNPIEMYSNLVVSTMTLLLNHFKPALYTPETADLYHYRIEKLLTRLQTAMNKHAYKPQEKECLKVLNIVINILQKFGTQNELWQVQLIQIAENFVPDTIGPQVLGHQIMIASFKKSPSRMKGNSSTPPVESKSESLSTPPKECLISLPKMADKKEDLRLAEENEKLRRQLQQAQQAAKKQRKTLTLKNKKLDKRLEKQKQEKTVYEQLLSITAMELKQLVKESTQLKTQLTEAQHRKTLLEQQQVALSEETRLALEAQKRREVAQREQEADWGRQLREQQSTLDSVIRQNQPFKMQVADNQHVAETLEVELKRTQMQLNNANKQMSQQTLDRKCDETAKSRKIESLQNEVERLRSLLPEPTSGRQKPIPGGYPG